MKYATKNILKHSPQINLSTLIEEAIANSLQANATCVELHFTTQDMLFDSAKDNIKQIAILDNGDGFTEENQASFNEYESNLKEVQWGCRGIGRFGYLKLFKQVSINSVVNNKQKSFIFHEEAQELEPQQSSITIPKDFATQVCFENPHQLIASLSREKCEEICSKFILTFKKIKEDHQRLVRLSFFKDGQLLYAFKSQKDLASIFECRKLKITDETSTSEVSIQYSSRKKTSNKKEPSIQLHYCAGYRKVKSVKMEIPAEEDMEIFILGKCLDKLAESNREGFQNKGLFGDFEQTRTKIEEQIVIFLQERGWDIEGTKECYYQEARKQYPFLGPYFNKRDSWQKDKMVNNAKEQRERDRAYIRDRKNYNQENYNRHFAKVTQSELAEYIFDRDKITQTLLDLKQNEAEKKFHDLFMNQRSNNTQSIDYKKSNLWLLDDSFMTYNKVFSDEEIHKFIPELKGQKGDNDRPDIIAAYGNITQDNIITDIVIIEFKKPDNKRSIAHSQSQLTKYGATLRKSIEKFNQGADFRLFMYAVVDFNEDFVDELERQDYNKQTVVGSDDSIYYKYHEGKGNNKVNSVINFASYKNIALLAKLRNKTFLDILEGRSEQ